MKAASESLDYIDESPHKDYDVSFSDEIAGRHNKLWGESEKALNDLLAVKHATPVDELEEDIGVIC